MSDSLLTQLLTSAQVGELLQLKRSTVEDYARRGLLTSLKLGRHRRFVRDDVEAALARLSGGTGVDGSAEARISDRRPA